MTDGGDDEGPVDEVAVAASLRRLDALLERHPDLVGPRGPENIDDWISTLTAAEGESNMANDPTQQVAFRLPESLLKRLDRHVQRMEHSNPGLTFTRVDAVRSLLTRALDEVEAADKASKGKR